MGSGNANSAIESTVMAACYRQQQEECEHQEYEEMQEAINWPQDWQIRKRENYLGKQSPFNDCIFDRGNENGINS